MKEYDYYGDLQKDIKKIKRNGKFNWQLFFSASIVSLLAIIFAEGIIVLIFGKLTSAAICSSFGVFLGHTIVNIIDSKEHDTYEQEKVIDLYKQINEECSGNIYDYDAEDKIKKCISVEKSNKIIEETNTMIPEMSDEEKIVRYFYLLDPKDQIQVLRQIKDEYTKVYLLDKEDIKRENIEIPIQKNIQKK